MIVLFSELSQDVFDKSPLTNYKSVAIIPNAKDSYVNSTHVSDIKFLFEKNDYFAEVVDLNSYCDDALFQKLINFQVVYVIGGNSFTLLEKVKSSGFDNLVPNLLDLGIVYAGHSAGAIILGPSIEPTADIDFPEYANLDSYVGLNYLDFIFIPHADNPSYFEKIEKIQRDFSNTYNIRLFNDNQGIVINEKTKEINYF